MFALVIDTCVCCLSVCNLLSNNVVYFGSCHFAALDTSSEFSWLGFKDV